MIVSLRLIQALRRRRTVSTPTAPTSTRPTTMSWSAVSTPIRTMPDESDCMMTAPSTPPAIVPMPPANDVPPMTAAAMTCSSTPVPNPFVAAFKPRRGHGRRDGGEHAHRDERLHDRQPGVDPGQDRGLRVAADGVDVAPESASCREKRHDHGDADRDEDRDGDPGRDQQATRRDRDPVLERVRLRQRRWPGVAVGDPHRTGDGEAADDPERDVRPHRAE